MISLDSTASLTISLQDLLSGSGMGLGLEWTSDQDKDTPNISDSNPVLI